MPTDGSAWQALEEHCERMYDYEPAPGKPKQGAGSASGGHEFEALVREYWECIGKWAEECGANLHVIREPSYQELKFDSRRLFVPNMSQPCFLSGLSPPADWFEYDFNIETLVNNYPGMPAAIERYAPGSGPYAGSNYLNMFKELRTRFDGSVALVAGNTLVEKILIECKTAKAHKASSNRMEGNAHERLTFQMMQYLEVATRCPKCTLLTISNGAYVRLRNKYHVSLQIQADRLHTAFPCFHMEQLYSTEQYLAFARGLLDWLRTGRPRKEANRK